MSFKNRIRLSFFFILILITASLIYDFPSQYNAFAEWMDVRLRIPLPKISNERPFLLGLDLQGGTHLVYEANVEDIPQSQRSEALEGVRDVLERRVNAFGVSEPVVQTSHDGNKWRVIVELAGVRDVNQAIQMIGETPWLDFRIQNTSTEPILTDEEKKELEEYNEDAKKRAEDILKQAQDSQSNFDELAQKYSEEPNAQETKGVLGFLQKGKLVKEFEEECFDNLTVGEVSQHPVQTIFGYHIIKKLDERGEGEKREVNCQHILIRTKTPAEIHPVDPWIKTELSGEHLKRAEVVFHPQTGEPQVSLEFNDEGKDLFRRITSEHIGEVVGIFLDGSPISTPRVNEPIPSGRAIITGNFTLEEAKLLAQRLNAGALRVPITLVSQQTIGPTLGKISIQKSLHAAIIGLIAVIIYLLLYYRLPGLLAAFSLIAYGALVLSLFKIIPVTLTLAGIAGFILSLGMAVDANVLIFERLKEELRSGSSLEASIPKSFQRAWPSIRDGNFSTLLTCLILIWFSTSIVKGFAITLGLGIFVSMFSGMIITRIFLQAVSPTRLRKFTWLFG